MKQFSLKYGNGTVELSVPDQVEELSYLEPECSIERDSFVGDFTKLLEGQAVDGEIAVVVADKTRLCGYEKILPWVVQLLEKRGASKERITFYIAYGTHPRQSDEESRSAYGSVYDDYRFIHHDCHESEAFISLGTTARGTNVEIRRDVIESNLIITIGAISHHYFAGYGGGRKLLFPGVAEKNAIYSNHRLFLDRDEKCLAVGCWPGNLIGNPLAEDLKEVHDMLPQYLSIHAILDSTGKPSTYYFGRSYEDFLGVCSQLDRYYMVETDSRFDLVVASAGGYPKDINIIQVHKSIHNAANLVRDGGTLVMLAECVDGVGSKTFLPYFRMGGWENTFSHLANDYAGNGGTALAMMEKTSRIRIAMVTVLPDEICTEIGVERITEEDAGRLLQDHQGSLALIANSSLIVTSRM